MPDLDITIKRLREDVDALILYGIAGVAALVWLLAPDAFVEQLLERGRLAVAVFGLPALAAVGRFVVRRASAESAARVRQEQIHAETRREVGSTRVDGVVFLAAIIASFVATCSAVTLIVEAVAG